MNKIYFYLFLVFICLVGLWVLSPYLNLIFFSFIVVNFFYPIYEFLEKRLKRESLATLLTLIIIFVICAIPVSFLIQVTAGQTSIIYRDINGFLTTHDLPQTFGPVITRINEILATIPGNDFRISMDTIRPVLVENVQPVLNYILDFSFNFSAFIIRTVPLIIVFAFVLWSSFGDYKRFTRFLKNISPLPDEIDNLYLNRITAMTNAMVRGTFFIAIIQGSVGAIILWVLGVPYVFFWWILMIFCSIVPLGAGFVTYPLALVQLALGNVVGAVVIFLAQTFFISHIDNILRPYLVPKEAEVHPIILLLSILGGVQVFGILGFIYGPIIMIILKTTVEVYMKYYQVKAPPLRNTLRKKVKTKVQ